MQNVMSTPIGGGIGGVALVPKGGTAGKYFIQRIICWPGRWSCMGRLTQHGGMKNGSSK